MSCRRIAMWTTPRNISTTMMRSFENRTDCAVIDEPLYAAYLIETGITHPMQEAILTSQPHDWQVVTDHLISAAPAPVWFQKHMCHHITEDMATGWLAELDHFFLIREPALMVASYANKMETVTADGLGHARQRQLFEEIAALTGKTPPVVDANQVLADPQAVLTSLCAAFDIPFQEQMLSWPAGPRDSDGAWAPHWYEAVATSTGFRPPVTQDRGLPPDLRKIAAEAETPYRQLHAHLLPV